MERALEIWQKTMYGAMYTAGVAEAGLRIIDAIRVGNIPADKAHEQLYRHIVPEQRALGTTLTRNQELQTYRSLENGYRDEMGGWTQYGLDLVIATAAIAGPITLHLIVNKIKRVIGEHKSIITAATKA